MYTSSEFNYSITIPENFVGVLDNSYDKTNTSNFTVSSINVAETPDDHWLVGFAVMRLQDAVSLTEQAKQNLPSLEYIDYTLTPTTVAGKDALTTEIKWKTDGDYGNLRTFVSDGKYLFVFAGDTTKQAMFDQWVSSFRFTDSIDPTANWKTYNNAQHGYSIKYPKDWVETDSFKYKNIDLVLLSAQRNADIKRVTENELGGDPTPSLRVKYYASAKDLTAGGSGEDRKSNAASLLDWLKSENQKKDSGGYVLEYKSKTIAGYPGYEVEQPNIGGISYWYIEKNDHIYAFQFDDDGADKIIETFKIN